MGRTVAEQGLGERRSDLRQHWQLDVAETTGKVAQFTRRKEQDGMVVRVVCVWYVDDETKGEGGGDAGSVCPC